MDWWFSSSSSCSRFVIQQVFDAIRQLHRILNLVGRLDQSCLKLPRDEEHSQKFSNEERYLKQATQVAQVSQNIIIFACVEPFDTAGSQSYLKVFAILSRLTPTYALRIAISIYFFEQFFLKFILLEYVEYLVLHADFARAVENIGVLLSLWVDIPIVGAVDDVGKQVISIICEKRW